MTDSILQLISSNPKLQQLKLRPIEMMFKELNGNSLLRRGWNVYANNVVKMART
jgi:hypothetical protein